MGLPLGGRLPVVVLLELQPALLLLGGQEAVAAADGVQHGVDRAAQGGDVVRTGGGDPQLVVAGGHDLLGGLPQRADPAAYGTAARPGGQDAHQHGGDRDEGEQLAGRARGGGVDRAGTYRFEHQFVAVDGGDGRVQGDPAGAEHRRPHVHRPHQAADRRLLDAGAAPLRHHGGAQVDVLAEPRQPLGGEPLQQQEAAGGTTLAAGRIDGEAAEQVRRTGGHHAAPGTAGLARGVVQAAQHGGVGELGRGRREGGAAGEAARHEPAAGAHAEDAVDVVRALVGVRREVLGEAGRVGAGEIGEGVVPDRVGGAEGGQQPGLGVQAHPDPVGVLGHLARLQGVEGPGRHLLHEQERGTAAGQRGDGRDQVSEFSSHGDLVRRRTPVT
ncbi:hypothetical protein CLV70_11836 [Pseudosporangium ferrugineum]|uniref:Uncharacterized protein n=1 Tax=Pseudosporangium ferrugineum TaxID=439699 RepID=A0A2T0RLF9_9ACTN|nr:hypothetical protein [Pseudosporangium ferrugineum]PRY21971.1 hypothetical protein CLV70_11836 [Pseudosporangium ferrugineum]